MKKKNLLTALLVASMLVGTVGVTPTPVKAKTDSHKIVPVNAPSSQTQISRTIAVGENDWAAVCSLGYANEGPEAGIVPRLYIKGKVKWKVVSGKKVIKIKKVKTSEMESEVQYKGLRAGTAKLQCTNRKRRITFKIKVIKPKVFKVKTVTPAIAKKIDKYRRKSEFLHVKFIAKSKKSAVNMNYKLNAEIRKQNPYSIALAPWDWGGYKERFNYTLKKTSKNTWICDCHNNETDMTFNVGSKYKDTESVMKPLFAKGKTLYPNIFSGSTFSNLSEAEQVFYLFDIACRSRSNASEVIQGITEALGYKSEGYVYESQASGQKDFVANFSVDAKAPNGKMVVIGYTPKGKLIYAKEEPSEEYLEKYSGQTIEIYKDTDDEHICSLNVLEYLAKYGRK